MVLLPEGVSDDQCRGRASDAAHALLFSLIMRAPRILAIAATVVCLGRTAAAADGLQLELGPPEPERPTLRLRTAEEILFGLTIGTLWYFRNPVFNSVDFQLHWDEESWRRKLLTFDAVRFDDNIFQTNAASHARSGMGYYQVARGNGFGPWASLAIAFAASTFWEYVVEFQENPSLNDIVYTPVGGMVLGESTFRLGEMFRRSSGSVVNDLGAALFDPFTSINDLFAWRRRRPGHSVDRFGLTTEMSHRLRLALGLGQTAGTVSLLSGESELASFRAYRRPGPQQIWTTPGALTAIDAVVALAPGPTLDSSRFLLWTSLMGRYDAAYRRDQAGGLRGRGRFVGLAADYDYAWRRLDGTPDFFSRLGVGPAIEQAWEEPPWALRLRSRLLYDFAMIGSLAYQMVPAAPDDGSLKSPLAKHGYYYAQGATIVTRLDASWSRWDAMLDGSASLFDSIDARDRYQEEVGAGVHLGDVRAELRAAVGVRPWGGASRLSLQLQHTWRSSRMGSLDREASDTTASLLAGVEL
jgi:hypothetical protein